MPGKAIKKKLKKKEKKADKLKTVNKDLTQQLADAVAAETPAPAPAPTPAPAPAPAPAVETPPTDLTGFQSNLNTSKQLALQDINDYFTSRGLNPADYQGQIDRAIQEVMIGVPQGATNVPGYFEGIAPNLYGQIADALQVRNTTALNNLFGPGFENQLIPSTADDAAIAEILSGAKGQATGYVQNLLDRGVITAPGYEAALGDVNQQEARVRAMLNELGGQVLTKGRTTLGDIASQGKLAASNLAPGQAFDPTAYKSQIDQALSEFSGGIGDALTALLPEGSLFKTGGLAARAGAGMGAQNTKVFSPNALAGLPEEENRQATPLQIF